MNDDEPQTVKRMLLYLYKLDYPDEDFTSLPVDHLAVDRSLPPRLQDETSSSTEEETNLGTAVKLLESTKLDNSKMMKNVLVYAIAEKYDIPELKKLAKRKFQTLVNSKWPHDNFHAVTEVVFSTTPEEDMGLRRIVMDICREHFQDILKDEESKATFLNNKLIAATVLDAAIQKNNRDEVLLDGALARENALKDEVTKVKADLREALGKKNQLMTRLDHLLEMSTSSRNAGVVMKRSAGLLNDRAVAMGFIYCSSARDVRRRRLWCDKNARGARADRQIPCKTQLFPRLPLSFAVTCVG